MYCVISVIEMPHPIIERAYIKAVFLWYGPENKQKQESLTNCSDFSQIYDIIILNNVR